MRAKRKVDWSAVWREYNQWYDALQESCPTCKHWTDAPDWEAQKRKIAEIVERRLADR